MSKQLLIMWISIIMIFSLLFGAIGCTETTPTSSISNPASSPTQTLTPVSAPGQTKTIEWDIQAVLPAAPAFGHYKGTMMHELFDKGWGEWLYQATNGRLKVSRVEPNAIFPNAEVLVNIKKGTIEAAFTSFGYSGGIVPETYIAGSLPFTWTSMTLAHDWYYHYGGYELVQEALDQHNIFYIPIIYEFPTGLAVKFECNSMNDIKGKKIRAYGAHSKWIEALGGSSVAIAYADTYMGMKLGTVDGAALGAQALEDIKLKEVATGFLVEPTALCPVDAIFINKDALNTLPEDIKNIVVRESKYYAAYAANTNHMQIDYVLAAAQKNYGLKTYKWSEEDTTAVRKLMVEKVWPEFAATNPRCGKMVESIKAHLKIFGLL